MFVCFEIPDSKRSDVDVLVVVGEVPCGKSNLNVNKTATTGVHAATDT
jgi:hypothetical protein